MGSGLAPQYGGVSRSPQRQPYLSAAAAAAAAERDRHFSPSRLQQSFDSSSFSPSSLQQHRSLPNTVQRPSPNQGQQSQHQLQQLQYTSPMGMKLRAPVY